MFTINTKKHLWNMVFLFLIGLLFNVGCKGESGPQGVQGRKGGPSNPGQDGASGADALVTSAPSFSCAGNTAFSAPGNLGNFYYANLTISITSNIGNIRCYGGSGSLPTSASSTVWCGSVASMYVTNGVPAAPLVFTCYSTSDLSTQSAANANINLGFIECTNTNSGATSTYILQSSADMFTCTSS